MNSTQLKGVLCKTKHAIYGILVFVFLCSNFTFEAHSQNAKILAKHFEGKTVQALIDMPATKEGVNIYPRKEQAVDYGEYGRRIKRNGIAIATGQTSLITKIHVKKKHIEVHLGGGGYGTLWDESSNSGSVILPKSKREKELEKAIKEETSSRNRKNLQADLDYLRSKRKREQRRLNIEAEEARQTRKLRIQEKRLHGGSRFNIRYDRKLTQKELSPESIENALSKYISFDPVEEVVVNELAPVAPDDIIYEGELRKGLLWAEVAALYGAPKAVSERTEGTLKVIACVFENANKKVSAEFVEGVLIRYSISSK